MDKVATGLSKCFAAVFPELTPAEILAATPATVKSWDSVATLNLLTVVEEEFAIEKIDAYIRKRLEPQESLGAA
jgi:acyl carrier protein